MSGVKSPIFESDEATVWAFSGSLLGSRHFLVLQHNLDLTFVVDSGFGVSEAASLARALGRETVGVFLTHGHFDHAGGAAYLARELKCPVRLCDADVRTLKSANFLLKILGYSDRMEMPDVELVESCYSDDILTLVACPGHTPGSVLVRCGGLLFTGDSVYADRVDAVVLPEQDNEVLRQSILASLELISSASCIFPGHGDAIAGSDLLVRNQDLVNFLNIGSS